MLVEIRAKNVFVFAGQITFSMDVDEQSEKFVSDNQREDHYKISKVAGIFGENNVGKTCLIRCIREVRNIILNQKSGMISNLYTDDSVCELGVTFLSGDRKFSYDFRYDVLKKEYIYEKFSNIIEDNEGEEKEEIWLLKDSINQEYACADEEIIPIMQLVAQGNILIYIVDINKFDKIAEMKYLLTEFADQIDIVDMNHISMEKTISFMKHKSDLGKQIVSFIKAAGLSLENFEYVDVKDIKLDMATIDEMPEEIVFETLGDINEQIRLISTYNGVKVPSIMFDSTGTKKIAALASYIVEGLEVGKILVVDDLEGSIHLRILKSVIEMYQDELNQEAQFIFTAHDIERLDFEGVSFRVMKNRKEALKEQAIANLILDLKRAEERAEIEGWIDLDDSLVASDEDVLEISKKMLAQNKEVYEVFAR